MYALKWLRAHAETVVGIVIVLVSVFGAYVTWRAAEAAGTASDFDHRSAQAATLRDQLRSEHESAVSYEQRLFHSFRDHLETAEALERDAAKIRGAPGEAGRLRREARVQRAVARALELPFDRAPVTGAYPGDPASRPEFDAEAHLAERLRSEARLHELRPRRLADAADQAREKRLGLVAIDTGVIAAIFFLTLSLLARRLRHEFALAGFVLVGAAAVAFVVVQLVIEVPAL